MSFIFVYSCNAQKYICNPLPEIGDIHSLLYALLEVVFPANFDNFLTGIAMYITHTHTHHIGGWQVGWGVW